MKSKIAMISGSTNLTKKMKEEIAKQNLEIAVYETNIMNAVDIAKKLVSDGTEVLISRGSVTSILRKNIDVSVVDIKHTFFGCYIAYKKAKMLSDKIVFLSVSESYQHMLEKSKEFLKGVAIIPINLSDDEDIIDSKLNELVEMGIDVAIGGLTLEKKVTALGIKYIMSESDSDSISESIEEALYLLKNENEKKERRVELEKKYEMINSIFNCISDGIISINQDGIISNINNNAIKILGQNPEGKHISHIIPSDIFLNTIKTGTSVSGEIINFGKISLVINIEPIKLGKLTIGAVAILQRTKHIQEVEQKIRHNMLQKGHISYKTFDDIIGNSKKINSTKELAKKYAAVDSTVLILGETGTGKELFAQSIHNASKRKDAPFVAINCAAFPSGILESELFGYVKGAFTGALNEGKAGMFELAHGGIIFLDEISETPIDVQLKLLRVIQERKIIRIGDDKVIPIDVRIITASNKDLKKQIEMGLFREDFYYRICVLELKVPSLEERKEDIPPLIRYFIRNSYIPVKGITDEAIDMLVAAQWPGNVRQLSNIIERLIVTADNNIITADIIKNTTDILDEIERKEKANSFQFNNIADSKVKEDADNFFENDTEEELIKKILKQTRGNRKLAAQKLGISTTTLWRKIKKIDRIDEHFLNIVKYGRG